MIGEGIQWYMAGCQGRFQEELMPKLVRQRARKGIPGRGDSISKIRGVK